MITFWRNEIFADSDIFIPHSGLKFSMNRNSNFKLQGTSIELQFIINFALKFFEWFFNNDYKLKIDLYFLIQKHFVNNKIISIDFIF